MSTQPHSATKPLAELVRDDVIEALMETDGFSRDRAEWALKVASGVTFSELYKSALGWLRNSRSAPKESTMQTQTAANANGHAPAPQAERRCKGYEKECSEVIGPRASLCSVCYARKKYAEKYSVAARGAKSAKRAQKPAKTTARKSLELAPPSLARVTLEVTEAQLNQFLVKLPLAEKRKLANHYLATVEE